MLYPGNGLFTSNVAGRGSRDSHCAPAHTSDPFQQHNLSAPHTIPFAAQCAVGLATGSKDTEKQTDGITSESVEMEMGRKK